MTSAVPASLVVVDTDVFSRVYVSTTGRHYRELRDRLVGSLPVIATETQAELVCWPRLRGWGPGRTRELERILAATTVIPVTPEVVDAYVTLRIDCQRVGHALFQKVHTADRWVAATALALDRPLISLDGIYRDTPGLTLG